MARKKTAEPVEEGRVALPMVDDKPPEEERPPEKQKPVVSYRINSDRTTSIELAVWSNTYRNGQGEEYEQLSVTVQRSYKTDEGWQKGGAWRIHDLPVLMFLIQKAHCFALDRRTTDSSCPF